MMGTRTSTRRTGTACAAVGIASLIAGCSSDEPAASTEPAGVSAEAAYCQQVNAFKTASNLVATVFSSSTPPTAAMLQNAFTAMQTQLHVLGANPPAAIKADIEVMATDIDAVVSAFSNNDWALSTLTTGPDAAALQQHLNNPAAATASNDLKAWAATNCGITSATVAS